MQQKKEIKCFPHAMVNFPLIFVSLAGCHILFDPSCPYEMISHVWWTSTGYKLKPTTYLSEIGYLGEDWTRRRWNLTDEPYVLAAHQNLPSVLVTHQNLLRCNNASYPRAERLYNHLVVCEYREIFRELSGQTTPLSLKSRGHRLKGTGIANSFQALFLEITRRY